MTDVGTAVPPGGDIPAPVRGPQQSPGAQLGWALASTAALLLWLAWQWGWVPAVAGLIGVLVHETGHLLVINALGCGPSRIHIIPFFGGAATMQRAPKTEFHGVLIAIAGPIAGLLAAVPFIIASRVTGDARLADGAGFIILINLLNMLPAPPLDGSKALGPALARIHPMVERAALVLIGGAVAYFALRQHNILFGAFVAVATLAALRRAPRAVSRRLNIGEWFASVGLWAGVLAVGVYALVFCFSQTGWSDGPAALRASGL
jgi:Zn-dependent protease